MSSFDEQLSRLRSILGVKEDQEVASALGMTKAAFSNRKKSQSFPVERVPGLLKQFPDLDVHYVLTGERLHPHDRVFLDSFFESAAKRNDPVFSASVARLSANATKMVHDALRNPGARRLVELLVWCDDDAIEMLRQMAVRLRSSKPMPFDTRASALAEPTLTAPTQHAPPAPPGTAVKPRKSQRAGVVRKGQNGRLDQQ